MNTAKMLRTAAMGVLVSGAIAASNTSLKALDPYCVFRGFYPAGQGFECYNEPEPPSWCTYADGGCNEACYNQWGDCGYANACYAQGLPANGHYNLLCECEPC
jgi:hypothetical protein